MLALDFSSRIIMDRDQAFAILGVADNITKAQIDALRETRTRRLKQRLLFAATEPERQKTLARIAELEKACDVATANLGRGEADIPETARFHIPLGTALCGRRYVTGHKLGFGDCASVFLADDRKWARDIALKVVPDSLLGPAGSDRRAELTALIHRSAGLAHPNIARVFSVEQDDPRQITFITEERLKGVTLRQMIRDRAAAHTASDGATPPWFSPAEMAALLRPVLAALVYASAHLNHLDLRPENIWREPDGTIKVSDFGVSALLLGGRISAFDTAGGRKTYLAPELLSGGQRLIAQDGAPPVWTGIEPSATRGRADQYALGAIIYELATGKRWKTGREDLSEIRPDLDPAFCRTVHRALSLASARRFETISAFSRALEQSHFGRKSLTGPLLKLAAGIATVLLLGGLGLTTWMDARSPGPAETWLGAKLRAYTGGDAYADQLTRARNAEARAYASQQALSARFRDLRGRFLDLRTEIGTLETRLEAEENTSAMFDMRAQLQTLRRDLAVTTRLRELVSTEIAGTADHLAATRALDDGMAAINAGDLQGAYRYFSRAEAGFTKQLEAFERARNIAATAIADEATARTAQAKAAQVQDGAGALSPASDLRHRFLRANSEREDVLADLDARMVQLPGGSFLMGDNSGAGNYTEQPAHRVFVPPFQISQYEVTFAEYDRCIADGDCPTIPYGPDAPEDRARMPVTNVSWQDVQTYLGWLKRKTGRTYRLPSEAEWEFAARAGAATAYPWGDGMRDGYANCRDCGSGLAQAGPAPVGSFPPNAFGLYDMTGNLWEWVADCWYTDYTGAPAVATPRLMTEGCTSRVVRGGSWDNNADQARVSYRSRMAADFGHDLNGFRLAYSPRDALR